MSAKYFILEENIGCLTKNAIGNILKDNANSAHELDYSKYIEYFGLYSPTNQKAILSYIEESGYTVNPDKMDEKKLQEIIDSFAGDENDLTEFLALSEKELLIYDGEDFEKKQAALKMRKETFGIRADKAAWVQPYIDLMYCSNENLVSKIKNGDKRAENALVLKNYGYITKLAYAYKKGYDHANVDVDDLQQAGSIGLLLSVDNYDPLSGNKFLTYAAFYIRKYIHLEVMRANYMYRVSERDQERIQKYYKVRLEYPDYNNDEIFNAMCSQGFVENRSEYNDLIMNASFLRERRLDKPINSEDSSQTLGEITQDQSKSVDDIVSDNDLNDRLRKSLERLTEEEKSILTMFYGLDGESLTIKQIAKKCKSSEVKVRKILYSAIDVLRNDDVFVGI